MRKLTIFFLFGMIFAAFFQLTSCKKATFYSTEHLDFSQDTIIFDTVFTTVGSTTKRLKIYNRSNRNLKVDELELMGGTNSPFRINVDGLSGTVFKDLEIEGNDSLFIFVEVTLDPNGGTLPLIIEDSIRFRTNGVDQHVVLAAWGQDAYFHRNDKNFGVWPNDKPHVIYGYAGVDVGQSLTIQGNTDIYLHKNSLIYVYKGELHIEGTLNEPVTLQGDRLEQEYDDVSGQYYGIYFEKALPSTINHTIIKNGTSGIHIYGEDPGNGSSYTVDMKNTVIQNCARYGTFIFDSGKLKAENCIISDNGVHSLLVLRGGDFNFNHCHLLSYGSGDGVGASIGITNYYDDTIGHINEGTITNSVIYGFGDHEIAMDTSSLGTLNFVFESNLIKSETVFSDLFFANSNLWNVDPLFTDLETMDYTWPSNSPLNNAGDSSYPTSNGKDINEDGRSTTTPDIGAFEKL